MEAARAQHPAPHMHTRAAASSGTHRPSEHDATRTHKNSPRPHQHQATTSQTSPSYIYHGHASQIHAPITAGAAGQNARIPPNRSPAGRGQHDPHDGQRLAVSRAGGHTLGQTGRQRRTAAAAAAATATAATRKPRRRPGPRPPRALFTGAGKRQREAPAARHRGRLGLRLWRAARCAGRAAARHAAPHAWVPSSGRLRGAGRPNSGRQLLHRRHGCTPPHPHPVGGRGLRRQPERVRCPAPDPRAKPEAAQTQRRRRQWQICTSRRH